MSNWIAVASANHVAIGSAQGFMQVNHGKVGPLRRIAPGDRVTYYSPTAVYGTKTPLQSFTAIGQVMPGDPYEGQMGGGFTPWRRNVCWWPSEHAAIAPLLPHLTFTAGKQNWGYNFRFGLFSIIDADFALIAQAMRCETGS